jgi:hypothetical protein
VEVKIGVQYVARELVLESTQTAEEVEKALATAYKSDAGLLSLTDDKGRKLVVPVDKIAYIEIAAGSDRRVGFGAG